MPTDTPIGNNSSLSGLLRKLAEKIDEIMSGSAEQLTAIPGLTLYRSTVPTPPTPCIYEPSLLIIPQGRKRVDLGKQSFSFGQTMFLLTSIELRIVSQVATASEAAPYLAFFLKLDMSMVREILHTEEVRVPKPNITPAGMALGHMTEALLAPCTRMVDMLATPQDVSFFGKLLQREIIYRLLQESQGDRLRSAATLGDRTHKTSKAVGWLRQNYQKPLNVNQLATVAGMSRSTLHHHFRGLTSMSPLQFQKQLRLHSARQKMLNEELDAASVSFQVGYESPSQFNREYKRFFGKPPIRDIQSLRDGLKKGL